MGGHSVGRYFEELGVVKVVGTRTRHLLREKFAYFCGEGLGVKGCADFCVVVEINEDVALRFLRAFFFDDAFGVFRFASACPVLDARCPLIQGWLVVAAGIQTFRAMQTAVHEIGRDVHQTRPLHCVGAN